MAKRGKRPAGDDSPLAERIQIRLYPDDIKRIDELIAAGYGDNRSDVIRRSLSETHRWTLRP